MLVWEAHVMGLGNLYDLWKLINEPNGERLILDFTSCKIAEHFRKQRMKK